ncbi:NAD(P)-dependent dehydrogenase (short-subunit alcohol dehydrogenase family) [Variovorax boronicumulans]|uniref:NAD(P)-dependent dehydrogenase (Short-subunit alcohol dehydrogenase family) n=1 Tax=Variovorax boronicumulans TaxID=436515 RepID=A0AAW8E6P4_9BURK|nr:SDR family oxidoreductase [Variovorax boronicumulans]MDP9882281.1 NAD(P)-dependent dehydrogenase (short-subunit alcohol dehydrogenase family) [Variovorax boronicumulans]MDP9927555.1 NAD(P)-dependent dehydrogenase (short-subunit alcohol dehydrogenase family) [Variovorax boronicumulans]
MLLPFRNVVLTGACGGLGQALARALIDGGARVALVGLDTERLAALAAQGEGRCKAYTPDVSDSPAMQAMAADWMQRFGPPDLVIANAGVAGGYDTAEADDLAVFRRMLEINLLGAATTFQPFVQPMRAQGRGALVGVASIAGWRGMPGNGAYCASKGGLIRYLESLRAELRGTGLTVHTVSPGYIRTALTAGNRFAMPGLLEADAAARQLLAGLAARREKIVLPRRIGWLSKALGLLPAPLHDHLLRGQPRKPRVGEAGATAIPGLNSPKEPPRR